jgi:hypothetical protein
MSPGSALASWMALDNVLVSLSLSFLIGKDSSLFEELCAD